MSDIFDYAEGATPVDPDEIEGLIPTHIVNRGQLDELEQANIAEAQVWLSTARIKKINEDQTLRKLHIKMFGKVWHWAGTFRNTGKNIGVDAYQIATELRNLCDDVDTWIEYSSYEADEIAARFHHRLVAIHAFPNGNGRHARLATDVLLVKQLHKKPFSWGRKLIGNNLDKQGKVRNQYIEALREADKGNYQALLDFVRS